MKVVFDFSKIQFFNGHQKQSMGIIVNTRQSDSKGFLFNSV